MKYLVCMEYSLALDGPLGGAKTGIRNPQRYVKFYAFDGQTSKIVGPVPRTGIDDELLAGFLFFCMNCHGAGSLKKDDKFAGTWWQQSSPLKIG